MQPQQPPQGSYPGYPQQGYPGAQPQGYAPQQPQQYQGAPQQPPKKKGGKLKYVLLGCVAVVLGIPCVLFAGWVGFIKLVENPAPSSDYTEIWDKYGHELEEAARIAANECRGYVDDYSGNGRPAIIPQGPTPLARPIPGIDETARLRLDPRLRRNRTVCGIDKLAGWSNGSHSIRGWVFPDVAGGRDTSVSNTWEAEQAGAVHGDWKPNAGLFPFLRNYENTAVMRWAELNGRRLVVLIVPHQTAGTPGLGQGTATIHVEFEM